MTVYLVGSGPGDPRLLTLRAVELLESAGAVVHDRLVDGRVLALAAEGAELHDVGKRPGGTIRQEEINDLLVSLAGRHGRVVRLKGGDPYVFGRGGEEALALEGAGIEFEVVPGVSSVNGVLAYAGIPVTHRGLATSYSVVTGHGADGSASGGPVPVDWEALARVGGTIVVLMGVAHRKEIAERLIAAGRPPSTPAAVIEHGTSLRQQTTRTTLDRLGDTDPDTPAILVIGEVAALDLSWFEDRPLFGWSVVVTRSRQQASVLAERLRDAGAEPVEVPTIEIGDPADGGVGLRDALGRIDTFDWVAISSANAAARLLDGVRDARDLAGVKVAAIGRATAGALRARGIEADLVPDVAIAEELAAAFPPPPGTGGRVLLPQAAGARDVLAEGLARLGYEVEVVEAYRTGHPAPSPALAAALEATNAIAFSSSSTVDGFLDTYGSDALPPVVVTIGPVTSTTARARGVRVDAEASEASVDGVVAALCELAASRAAVRRG